MIADVWETGPGLSAGLSFLRSRNCSQGLKPSEMLPCLDQGVFDILVWLRLSSGRKCSDTALVGLSAQAFVSFCPETWTWLAV